MVGLFWADIFENMLLWVTFNIIESDYILQKSCKVCKLYWSWCLGDNLMDGSRDFMVTSIFRIVWWPKIGYIWDCYGHLKVSKCGFGKLYLNSVNSCALKFVWRLLYNIQVMWLCGDLKLAICKMLWSP